MPATTVDAATDTEREPDAATAAEKSAVTLNYEAMLAALNGMLAEMREERRQAEASGNVVDAQNGQEQATTQPPNVWVDSPGYNPRVARRDGVRWPSARVRWLFDGVRVRTPTAPTEKRPSNWAMREKTNNGFFE